ncbi:MAG: hypothetical protein HY731_07005 [Candidatus Tectomicrobia bacterium]|nr:hypothetical protein [Candidatus Tectomicrobia bacterium]
MNVSQWQQRHTAWKRFHKWECTQHDRLSSSERLARVGELAEFFLSRYSSTKMKEGDLKRHVTGIQTMQKRLQSIRVVS